MKAQKKNNWWKPLLKTILVMASSSTISIFIIFPCVLIYNYLNKNQVIILEDSKWLEDGICFSFISYLTSIIAILFIKKVSKKTLKNILNISIVKIKDFLIFSIFILLLIVCMYFIYQICNKYLNLPNKIFFVDAYQNMNYKILFWIALLIATPIYEEFLFRGYLFSGIQNSKLGNIGALLLSALLFSAIHFRGLFIGIFIFCLGLLLGWARIKTKGVFVPIIMHFLWNSICMVGISIS